MRVAEWEFRQRFWVIFALVWIGFLSYRLDPINVVSSLVRGAGISVVRSTHQLLFALAALLAAAGAAMRTWAAAYLRSEVVHDSALHDERLVADGPYRHVRNPLYLGLVLAAIGMAAMMSRLGALFTVVAISAFCLRLIAAEEAALQKSGGAAYQAYRDAVPRLLPALRPRLPAGGAQAAWAQAFAGEAFFWMMALGLAAFAATLRTRVFLWAVAISLVGRGLLAVLWWRRPPSPRAEPETAER